MKLFDVVNSLFNKKEYAKIPDSEKRKHFFMIQRFMSVKYPLQANAVNRMGIDEVRIVDIWHKSLCAIYSGKPKWLFTKTKKKEDDKDEIDKFSDLFHKHFRKVHGIDPKQFEEYREFFPQELHQEMKALSDEMKENGEKLEAV